MSKRRISKQQSTRIAQIQANYQNSDSTDNEQCQQGLVITRFGKLAEIEDNDGNRRNCAIRSNIDSLVAGDRVIWQTQGDNQGVILSRFERTTALHRNEKKVVAANISQLVIVVAAKPLLSWTLLDTYLVWAHKLALKPLIVLNKMDLPGDEIKKTLNETYRPLGYNIVFTSKEDTASYLNLQQQLQNEVNVFVGQSGVGKSSLIAALLPHEKTIAIAAISTISELGCHTTSHSRFYHLPSGGALIDSPGVREFAIGHMTRAEIIQGFPEFRLRTNDCKFRNCDHIKDPGCAIVKAVDTGECSRLRYQNLLTLCC